MKYLMVCGLRVLQNLKVVLGQIRNQSALFVFHVKKELDHIDVHFQRGCGLVLLVALAVTLRVGLASQTRKFLG